MSYDGLLLDFDGVVVRVLPDEQRIPAFEAEIAETFNGNGLSIDEDIAHTLAHSVTYETLKTFSEETEIDLETLWRHRDDALATVLQRAGRDGSKGPYDDVTALETVDLPIGIASNNQQRVVEAISDANGLSFGAIRAREPTPESLHNKKPEPVFLRETMTALDLSNPLFVGDKESDIVAGHRLGVDTAFIRRQHNADRQIEAEPSYEVADLEEVVGILHGQGQPDGSSSA